MYGNNKIHNIISTERGMELIKEGYYALDPHCHSSFSYDVPDVKDTSPENVIRVQKTKGLMNVLTDHNTISGYEYLKKRGYSRVIPAVELTFKPQIARKITFYKPIKPIQTLHINIFGLDRNDLIALKEISGRGDMDELIKYLKQNDLEWMYNHPFYHEKKEKLNWKVIPELAKNYFDVIELNATYTQSVNTISQRIAEKLGKGVAASSDSHTGNPGRAYVIAEGKNFRDFWGNVKNGDAYIMRKDMHGTDLVREASLMVNQAFSANNRRKSRPYTPDTGFDAFDNIAKSVTSGTLKNTFIIKNILRMLIQSLKYTAGPFLAWRLHVTKDEEKAEKIRHKIHAVTDRLNHIKNKIRIKKQRYDKKYYGMDIVKNSKK